MVKSSKKTLKHLNISEAVEESVEPSTETPPVEVHQETPVETSTEIQGDTSFEMPVEANNPASRFTAASLPKRVLKNIKLFVIAGGIFLVFAALVCTTAFFYFQYRSVLGESKKILSTTTMTKAQMLQSMLDKLGKIAEIPTDDTPTIATVSDITKLKDNPFFADAQNGDKVFIFQSTGKAYLYRPSTDKIININSVNFINQGNHATSEANLSGSETTPNVVILNSTTVPNLTLSAQKKISNSGISVNVINRADANNTYDATLVVDLTGVHPQDAEKIANAVHGIVGALPSGETATASADILVILGTNYTQ